MIIKKQVTLFLLVIFSSVIFITSVFAISIPSISELYSSDTLRVFEFTIVNNNGVLLDSVNWTLDLDDGTVVDATQNVNLNVSENMTVIFEYNYTTRGTFNINATANNGTLTDSANLTIIVSDLTILDFDYLHLNQTEFVFEFIINNTATTNVNDINFSLDLNDGNTTESIYPFNLSSGEDIHVYVQYNYTTVGKYSVVANAYNSINNITSTLSVKTNTSPVISPSLPDVTFDEDENNATIDLDEYVTDEDADADLVWTVNGNSSNTVRVDILTDNKVNFSGALNYNNDPNGVNITFAVTDIDGLKENDTILVIIEKTNDPPTINWSTPENNVTQFVPANGQLQFNHTSTDADPGDVGFLTYNWSLDGTTQTTYQAWLYQPITSDAGDHVINLTVKDPQGITDSLQWNITVYLTYCNEEYNITMDTWTVNSDVKCENETIPLKSHITVENNGNLTFRNITLQINNTVDGEHTITVQSGGRMNIYDLDNDKSTTDDQSIIERGDPLYGYNIIVDAGAVFEMKNSKLTGAGYDAANMGLEISADNSIIQNNEITNNYYGLTIFSNNNLIENNNLAENTKYGIYVTGLNNNISTNIINSSGGGGVAGEGGVIAENIISDLLIDNNLIVGPTKQDGECVRFSNVNQSNITLNNITDCDYGIFFWESSHNTISDNSVSSNEDTNIYIGGENTELSKYNIIKSNIVSQSASGIYFKTSLNNRILNTLISDNTNNLVFENGSKQQSFGSDNNIIQDSTISNSATNDILYNQVSSNNTLINTTFDKTKLNLDGGGSNLTVKWYLDVYVNDSNGNNAANTLVQGHDKDDNLAFSVYTDENGDIPRQTLEEFTRSQTGPPPPLWDDLFKTNYTLTASNSSHEATTSVNLTESKEISLTLEAIPLYIHNLSVLDSDGMNRTFEFEIKNQLTVNLTGVSWQFDTKDNNLISSAENVNLAPDETMFVYFEYNFSSTGTYNVNATAINGSLIDSVNLSITIT